MEKQYFLCEYVYGGTGTFYQEVENGIVLRLVTLDGLDINNEEPYGYSVINAEPLLNLFD